MPIISNRTNDNFHLCEMLIRIRFAVCTYWQLRATPCMYYRRCLLSFSLNTCGTIHERNQTLKLPVFIYCRWVEVIWRTLWSPQNKKVTRLINWVAVWRTNSKWIEYTLATIKCATNLLHALASFWYICLTTTHRAQFIHWAIMCRSRVMLLSKAWTEMGPWSIRVFVSFMNEMRVSFYPYASMVCVCVCVFAVCGDWSEKKRKKKTSEIICGARGKKSSDTHATHALARCFCVEKSMYSLHRDTQAAESIWDVQVHVP